jgi:hypothetical protein
MWLRPGRGGGKIGYGAGMSKLRPNAFIAAMVRAAILASVALSIGGCELGRTAVPSQYSQHDDWAAAQAACARDGRVPVAQYERALISHQTAFHCELPGEMLGGGR